MPTWVRPVRSARGSREGAVCAVTKVWIRYRGLRDEVVAQGGEFFVQARALAL